MNGVAPGEGKGWAKGRSAKDDPRVARAAAAHRGMAYTPRLDPSLDRRRMTRPASTAWTPALAYAVGLLAADGCQTDGRHLSFPSADRELVELLLRCLSKTNKITTERGRSGGIVYRTQIGDVALCRWLLGVGITPRKSLTLGALVVPDELFVPLARGLLDGDGSIINKRARADTRRRSDYHWEYLRTSFLSASREHITWLQSRMSAVLGVRGYIALERGVGRRHDMFTLRFGKRESLLLLPALYSDPSAPRLTRKLRVWEDYRARHRDLAS